MPHVIALVDDLMALSRIREAARAAGAEVRAARRAEEAAALVSEGARLVLVDAEASRLPWPEAVAAVRRDGPADLPIVAFFSHVHAERAAAARAAGCTRVIPRSAFAQELPTLVAGGRRPTRTGGDLPLSLDCTIAKRAALAALALGALSAACGGGSAPPPPVATAAPAPATGDRPLSSREAGAPPAGAPGAAPFDASAPLPPGHPPVGAPDPHGNLPGAPGAPERSAGSITGTITLSPKLQVSPTDVLYLMAKKDAATLAVRRIDKPTFPYAFELSGGDAMMAGGSFEGPVDVVARVSKTGDAIPAKGDLEGTAKGVAVPSKDVKLTIDSVRP